MVLKVDNDELKYFTKKMDEDSSDFSREIDTLISLVNSLETVWQGIDSKTYRENVLNYLEKMKSIPAALTTLSRVTDKLNDGYTEKNQSFSQTLQEVTNRYAK
mgnify:CR=1 FL=1